MASLTVRPTLWNSAHRPILYQVTTDFNFKAATDNGGNLELIIASSQGIGNFVVGSNVIIPSGTYEGTYKVLSKYGNSIVLNGTYTSGASGTIISTRIPCKVYAGYDILHPGYVDQPYRKIADFVGIRNATTGYVDIDVSGFIKSMFKTIYGPRLGRDFNMSVPFRVTIGSATAFVSPMRYALNGTFKQALLQPFDDTHKILNAREPIHFVNGRTIYSMIWQDDASDLGEHIVNIVATNGTATPNAGSGIGYWEIGSTFIVQ